MTKIVITGGPCSGKSTLVKELERRKYLVVHEVAEDVFREERVRDHTRLPYEESLRLQRKIADRQIQIESGLAHNDLFFLTGAS